VRVLITGCAGFIGSHLAESLLADSHSIVGVDCFNENYARDQKLRNLERARQWSEFDFVPIDLARGELASVLADCEVVFHLAAEPGVRMSWGAGFESYVRNNIVATQNLLEAVLHSGSRARIVYASSSSIYGQARQLPTSETTTPAPHSPYGITKLAAEHLCQAYHANHGLDIRSLRYFSVYGPRQRPDMAFDRFCRAALCGEQMTVFSDGRQTRDFTYIDDVVQATRLAATAGVDGRAYNVGGGSTISLRDALDAIADLNGGPLDLHYGPPQSGDVRDTLADTAAIAADLGFVPSTPFVDGIAAQFDWVKEDLQRVAC